MHVVVQPEMAGKRILVHAKKASDSSYVPINFNQSVLDFFGSVADQCYLKASLVDDRLLISDETAETKIKRPSFCPVHHLTSDQCSQIPGDILGRGVDVGAATLLESCDGHILLTRRAAHLRTFPGVWVPPGGHIETGETLFAAACRELKEETGLSLTADMCEQSRMSILALWESAFPPMLSLGLPRRHHVVVYFHAKLKDPHTAQTLQKQVCLDPEEVGASAWLDADLIRAIVSSSDEEPMSPSLTDVTQHFKATVVTDNKTSVDQELPTAILLNTAPPSGKDIERVSTGTKFALSEWLKKQTKQQTKL